MNHCFTKITMLSCLLFMGSAMHNTASAARFDRAMQPGTFKNKNDDYKRLMGLTAGVGQIKTENEQGSLVYANLYMFWFNFSVEYQNFDERSTTNTYTGLGLGRYLQIQYGYGDDGYIMRARSEFEVVGKFTVFFARERYRDKPEFDNYSAGIGYNF